MLGPIDEVRGRDGGMANLIRRKGTFPSRLRRFCTEELKVKPLAAYVRAAQDEFGECVNAVGIRAAESKARSKLPEWEWSDTFDCEVWRPLIRWSEVDVIAMHTRHGLRPNPLYLKDAERVGCFPRIFARKAEVRLVADLAPERIEEIRQLEVDVTAATVRGSAHPVYGSQRTFFHGKLSREGRPFPSTLSLSGAEPLPAADSTNCWATRLRAVCGGACASTRRQRGRGSCAREALGAQVDGVRGGAGHASRVSG